MGPRMREEVEVTGSPGTYTTREICADGARRSPKDCLEQSFLLVSEACALRAQTSNMDKGPLLPKF